MAIALLSIAISLGGMVLQALFSPKPKTQYGSRLSDLNVTAVSPGNPIVHHWGTMKLNGQVLWTSDLVETKHTKTSGGSIFTHGQKSVTYTYSVSVAGGVSSPIYRFRRIRANQKLIWVNDAIKGQLVSDFENAYVSEGTRLLDLGVNYEEAHVSAFFFAFNNYRIDEFVPGTKADAKAYVVAHPLVAGHIPDAAVVNVLMDKMFNDLDKSLKYDIVKTRFTSLYLCHGTENQKPNAVIEAHQGVGNVSGYRGVAYFVLDQLQLEDFGNSLPQLQAEVEKTDGSIALVDIIADVCLLSGLSKNDFSVASNIPLITIPGYAITQVSSGRTVLQGLQQIYPFDGQETSYKIRFGWSDRRPQILLRRQDYNARMSADESGAAEEITRLFDYDMPKRLNFAFQEPARNYSANTVSAFRTETDSNTVENLDATIAMDRAEAKLRVETALANRYKARRVYKIRLPRKYVILEPGDVVLVPFKEYADRYYPMQLVEVAVGANGIVESQFTDYHTRMVGNSVDGVTTDDQPDSTDDGSEAGTGQTRAYLLDIPLLTDAEEDNVGFYCVLAGASNKWTGGGLVIDLVAGSDLSAFGTTAAASVSGTEYYTLVTANTPTPNGYTYSVLGTVDSTGVWDRINKLRVFILNSKVLLKSYTEDDLMRTAYNVCVIGDEIVQFANATDLGNGLWELDTFIRGLRGTEYAINSHERGERFVRLTTESVQRVDHSAAELNTEQSYLALSTGEDPASADTILFADTGNSLRPYAPQIRHAYKTTTPDVVLDWLPRLRQREKWLPGAPTDVDQPYEKYEIEVWDTLGEVLYNLIELGAVRTWTYTAATRLADGPLAGDTLLFRVYQIGRVVGRGFAAEVRV